jgi:hypothetical protein
MTCQIPSEYQTYVTQAAKATGLSQAVICAQINEESGWNPNAQSDAGAEGIAQFEPGTFSGQGCSGTPYNPGDAFACYSKYMSSLLTEEGGSVQKALEAYNAGPGNLAAGAGYADTILSNAGQGVPTTANPSGGSSGGSSSNCIFSFPVLGCVSFPFEGDIKDWLERGALMVFGAIAIIVGLVIFVKAPNPKMPDYSQLRNDDDDESEEESTPDASKPSAQEPSEADVRASLAKRADQVSTRVPANGLKRGKSDADLKVTPEKAVEGAEMVAAAA